MSKFFKIHILFCFIKVLITGSSGTIGKSLQTHLQSDFTSVSWDRNEVQPYELERMFDYVNKIKPTYLYHFATASYPTGIENEGYLVDVLWSAELAKICEELNIHFVFTSSVMVYSDSQQGPFTVETIPEPNLDYGKSKLKAEELILNNNSHSYIFRLGWQIDIKSGGNTMYSHLTKLMNQKGVIKASTKWFPACSFLEDTIGVLIPSYLQQLKPGLYLIDSNSSYSYFEIVSKLANLTSNNWVISQDDKFVSDQRMLDRRIMINSLKDRFESIK